MARKYPLQPGLNHGIAWSLNINTVNVHLAAHGDIVLAHWTEHQHKQHTHVVHTLRAFQNGGKVWGRRVWHGLNIAMPLRSISVIHGALDHKAQTPGGNGAAIRGTLCNHKNFPKHPKMSEMDRRSYNKISMLFWEVTGRKRGMALPT